MRTFWVEPITYVSVDSPEAWEEMKRYWGLQAERKKRYLEGLPPARRERLMKEEDFRPEACERCCQLAWEDLWWQHVWSKFEPPTPRNPKSVEEVKASQREWLAREHPRIMARHWHLVHERHIFALLPPPWKE
jgi:hypothetical protein